MGELIWLPISLVVWTLIMAIIGLSIIAYNKATSKNFVKTTAEYLGAFDSNDDEDHNVYYGFEYTIGEDGYITYVPSKPSTDTAHTMVDIYVDRRNPERIRTDSHVRNVTKAVLFVWVTMFVVIIMIFGFAFFN